MHLCTPFKALHSSKPCFLILHHQSHLSLNKEMTNGIKESHASSSKVKLETLSNLLTSQKVKYVFQNDASSALSPFFSSRSIFDPYETMLKSRLSSKMESEYRYSKQLPKSISSQQQINAGPTKSIESGEDTRILAGQKRKAGSSISSSLTESYIEDLKVKKQTNGLTSTNDHQLNQQHNIVALRKSDERNNTNSNGQKSLLSSALVKKKDAANRIAKPTFHPQWKLSRVISGHLGWVRCIAVEPNNKWFATGAGDRMIKIWDLASGELKLSLTGHISTVRGLAISSRHPYMFSCGEDKMVKCWDLETNKVIRQYHGHLSGVYCLALHPTLDVLITAGRDAVARVWDMRTKAQIHVLSGHKGTVASVICQESDPQVITGSMDATVRLWDLAAGKSISTLTHHKKSVRALSSHPQQFSFASGSSGGRNIKTWRCPEGTLMNNMTHDSIVNTLSTNPDGVLFSGGDDGSMKFFDYDSGVAFQSSLDIPQPGSLESEAGIFCSSFDQTGTRLLTGGSDKTIKMYKETS